MEQLMQKLAKQLTKKFQMELTTTNRISKSLFFLATAWLAAGCSSEKDSLQDPIVEKLQGTISYPFASSPTIGMDAKSENFVIKTSVGSTEYSVEIPHGGQDYDIVIPIAQLGGDTSPETPYKDSEAVTTDKEMISSLPTLENQKRTMTSLLDKAYGAGKKDGPSQAPSYTLKLAKIKNHYKKKNYELSLIEVNKLLSFYPTSAQLYKMKGSIFLKMRQLKLAERSWIKAVELDPSDKVVRTGIAKLQTKMLKFTTPDQRIPGEISEPMTNDLPDNMLGH